MIGILGLVACGVNWYSAEFSTTYTDPIPVKEEKPEPKMHHPDVVIYPISYRQEEPITFGYAGGNMINLRAKPSTKSPIISKLPIGTQIHVLEQAKKAKQGLREDYWYKVSAIIEDQKVDGFLFGPTINPHQITADFDLDGEPEFVYASYNERKEMLIHYHNPNATNPLAWTIIGKFSNEYGISGDATLTVIPASKSGIPLLKIEVDCTTECQGAVWRKYLSFSDLGIKRALEIEENESTDSRVFVDFNAGKQHVHLTFHNPDGLEKQNYALVKGVYRPVFESTENVDETPRKEKSIVTVTPAAPLQTISQKPLASTKQGVQTPSNTTKEKEEIPVSSESIVLTDQSEKTVSAAPIMVDVKKEIPVSENQMEKAATITAKNPIKTENQTPNMQEKITTNLEQNKKPVARIIPIKKE